MRPSPEAIDAAHASVSAVSSIEYVHAANENYRGFRAILDDEKSPTYMFRPDAEGVLTNWRVATVACALGYDYDDAHSFSRNYIPGFISREVLDAYFDEKDESEHAAAISHGAINLADLSTHPEMLGTIVSMAMIDLNNHGDLPHVNVLVKSVDLHLAEYGKSVANREVLYAMCVDTLCVLEIMGH